MDVELVIVSLDRETALKTTIESVRQLYPKLPICVGLQGPGVDVIAARLTGISDFRVVSLATPSVTRTLNQCIASSTAEIVLLLDDDAAPCQGWLEAHLSAFAEDNDLAYSSGREIRLSHGRSVPSEILRISVESLLRLFVPKRAMLQGRIVGWLTPFGLLFGNLDQPGTCVINAPRGCNMAIRRTAFRACGGFNTAFRGNAWGFEPEFGIRLAKSGQLGRYLGNAVVLHAELSSGGTRQRKGRVWFSDFWHNHRVLMLTLGPQGWLGSVPRLLARWLNTRVSSAG